MKKKILFVEDDAATLDVYGTVLKGAGFKLEVITLGEEAIKRIKKMRGAEKPDLVLLDLILPDINGIEVLKEIRKQKEMKNLPVFILTNYTDEQLEKKGIRFDSEKYLAKTDYSPNRLVELIKERLKK
jgi:two-component system alkaline phosphatase synthesis response regulator PhoP